MDKHKPSFDSTSSNLPKPFRLIHTLLHRIRKAHFDDGTDDYSHHTHKKRRLAQETRRQARRDGIEAWRHAESKRPNMGRVRTVSAEDRILERGANPRTGMVSPFTPAVIGGDDYIGDLVPMAQKRSKAQKRCNSDGRWRQNSSGWDMVPPTPGPVLTPPVEESLETQVNQYDPARSISIQALQDQLVVKMPGVDDPAPKNMTDAQIRKYQRAVSMMAKAGGSEAAMLVPDTIRRVKKETASTDTETLLATPVRAQTIPRKPVGSSPSTPTTNMAASTSTPDTLRYFSPHAENPPLQSTRKNPSHREEARSHEIRPAIKRQVCASAIPQLPRQERTNHEGRPPRQERPNQGRKVAFLDDSTPEKPHPLQVEEENALTPNILLDPQQWFQGHWAGEHFDDPASDALSPNHSKSKLISTAKKIPETYDDTPSPSDLVPFSQPSYLPSFFPNPKLTLLSTSISHILMTLQRAPPALKILRSTDADQRNVPPKVYFRALKDVVFSVMYMLVALRLTTTLAEVFSVVGGILRWGWVCMGVGIVAARWVGV